jgi:glycosyltransferase involved in cell wall biosynthesis
MKKKISCVLTVHNKENLIAEVCNGIASSISKNVDEIIVVLDGCVDNSEKIIRESFVNLKNNVKYIYTNDVFELKANNAGLKAVTNDYVILIQDDMVINEKNFDQRMLKPFIKFTDVFAVTAQTAHNNRVVGNFLLCDNPADRRDGYPRDKFAVREIANRGPLMYDYRDVVKLNYFDEFLAPNSYDDHDMSYRAYHILGKVSGLYWVDYQSDPEWGTGRQKNVQLHLNAHARNSKIIIERYRDLLDGSIKNEDRDLT